GQLEYELQDKRGLFGKKVDIDRCWQLVLQLKQNLPLSLQEAQNIVQDKENLLKNADNIAQNMINEAESRISSMLDRASLQRRAEIESQKIISDTNKKCDQIILSTKQHIDMIFNHTEQYLQGLMGNIQASRIELNDNMK
ncbi:MAG: hypothetical protein FWF58_01240, partial [Firmicutes bacterium]|nr:hypothetical protein [Bacillota bacterium]